MVCVCVLGRSLATVHRGETVKRICCSFLLMAQSAGRSKKIIKDDSILGRCFVLSFFLFTSCETRNATRPDGSAPMNWMEAIDRDVAASFFFAFVVVFCLIENHYDHFLFFRFVSPVRLWPELASDPSPAIALFRRRAIDPLSVFPYIPIGVVKRANNNNNNNNSNNSNNDSRETTFHKQRIHQRSENTFGHHREGNERRRHQRRRQKFFGHRFSVSAFRPPIQPKQKKKTDVGVEPDVLQFHSDALKAKL